MRIISFLVFLLLFGIVDAQKYFSDSIQCYSDSILLAGTLTYPSQDGQYPAVIIISGTGKQDRDASFADHRPFYEIADCLTQKGFAVLRMDDRGVGKSKGLYEEATTKDFAKDVLAEIDFLKNNPHIDAARIGLIGHSEGGAVAFMLSATSPDVKFMVSLAGLAVDGYNSLIYQNKAILESSPYIDSTLVDDYMDLYTTLFKAVKDTPIKDEIDPVLDLVFEQWISSQTEESLKAFNMLDGRDINFIYRYKSIARSRWYREMIQYNPADYLSKITIPVLALNGDKDIMVTPDENLANIDHYLNLAGNKHYKLVRLEGHNHLFQHCKECTQSEMRNLPEPISQETLDILSEWLMLFVYK